MAAMPTKTVFLALSSISSCALTARTTFPSVGRVGAHERSVVVPWASREPMNPDLVAGDTAVIFAAACYQQLVTIVLDDSFPGWTSPIVDDSFANVASVVGGSALWACIWVVCGSRHRVFSAVYATSFSQLLHSGVDAACVQVILELLRVVATHEPTSMLAFLSGNANNVLWLLTWRLARSLYTPF